MPLSEIKREIFNSLIPHLHYLVEKKQLDHTIASELRAFIIYGLISAESDDQLIRFVNELIATYPSFARPLLLLDVSKLFSR